MMRHPGLLVALRACLILICLMSGVPSAAQASPLEFHVTFNHAVSRSAFTGRVYVMLNQKETKELPAGFNWFKPEPIFARGVKDWKPGETLIVGIDALGFPHKLADLPKETYSIHAVMDFDRGERWSRPQGGCEAHAVRRLV